MIFQSFLQQTLHSTSRKNAVWLIGLIFIDQLSKTLAPESWQTLNQGIAFGLQGVPVVLAGLALLGIAWVWLKVEKQLSLSMSFFLAGAISNGFDRWWFGGVRDWLPLGVGGLTNNLADYWIVLGILGVVMRELRHARSS